MAKLEHMIVIYHSDCPDGFTAAWAAWLLHPDATFVPASHGDPPPDVKGKDVVIADFSYDLATVRRVREDASTFALLDHHQSALELAGEPGCVIDQSRSGAAITWDYFHPNGSKRPPIVDYVQDRDLWRHELPHSREVSAYIASLSFKFDEWSAAAKVLAEDLPNAVSQGEAIERFTHKAIARMVKRAYTVSFPTPKGEARVPAVNTAENVSDVLHELSENQPFAVAYAYKDGMWKCSLRSSQDGEDVARIAEQFGGGGHKHAAGFETASIDWAMGKRAQG
ncbi:MAG TPA: DHHA1 domain-containing protein [Chloroflexota bacterium]|nr:DHHA1 domain-containing protein [Chloroflexota bacterium]